MASSSSAAPEATAHPRWFRAPGPPLPGIPGTAVPLLIPGPGRPASNPGSVPPDCSGCHSCSPSRTPRPRPVDPVPVILSRCGAGAEPAGGVPSARSRELGPRPVPEPAVAVGTGSGSGGYGASAEVLAKRGSRGPMGPGDPRRAEDGEDQWDVGVFQEVQRLPNGQKSESGGAPRRSAAVPPLQQPTKSIPPQCTRHQLAAGTPLCFPEPLLCGVPPGMVTDSSVLPVQAAVPEGKVRAGARGHFPALRNEQ